MIAAATKGVTIRETSTVAIVILIAAFASSTVLACPVGITSTLGTAANYRASSMIAAAAKGVTIRETGTVTIVILISGITSAINTAGSAVYKTVRVILTR